MVVLLYPVLCISALPLRSEFSEGVRKEEKKNKKKRFFKA